VNSLLYDLTHLSHRAEIGAPSGIDRVDLMYARALANSPRLAGAVHYGVSRPSLLEPSELGAVVARAQQRWRGQAQADPGFARLRGFLVGADDDTPAPPATSAWRRELIRRARIGRYKLKSRREAPQGAVYLNIAQHALERRAHFQWLAGRPDIKPVFFLHDLLPLDYPEFWPAGHEERFERRIATLFELARAILVSSEAVAERVREELRRRGLAARPMFVRPLPSPLQAGSEEGEDDPELAATPYFVALGTIEPRKNHLALLNIWRAMVEAGETPPKLVLVGGRGWLNAETCAALDRARALKGHVAEAAGLGDAALRRLLRHARALLAPSFAEGYGLPLVEALELGAPVVASDLPIFREVSRGAATLIPPTDGVAWREAVWALSDAGSPRAQDARARARAYRGPDAGEYFAALEAFLQSL